MTANVLYMNIHPSPMLAPALVRVIESESRPDALILGTFATGTIPTDPPHILDAIRLASSKGIPVFGIRQSIDDLTKISLTEWGEEIRPGVYETEIKAITAGLIPLQQSCGLHETNRNAVISGIREICETYLGYDERVKAARERFSSPYFNECLDEVMPSDR